MIRYKGIVHRTLETIFFVPLLLLGIKEEKQTHRIPMLDQTDKEQFNEQIKHATHAEFQISTAAVQYYSANVYFLTYISGLR